MQPLSVCPRLRRTLRVAALLWVAACAGPGAPDRSHPGEDLLQSWLQEEPARFGEVLSSAEALRLKIELAVVVHGQDGVPTLERHSFDAGPEYFYPASSVKTCAAIAAALRMREVEAAAGATLGLSTPLRFAPLFDGEALEELDATHIDGGKITLGHALRKVFLVSDNVAFNHLYEFAGNAYLNETMRGAGLASTRILHRLSEFHGPQDQLRTPSIELLQDGAVVAALPERSDGLTETNAGMTGVAAGEHYYSYGQYHDGPFSFLHKNYMSLRDLQDMHIMLLRPDIRIPGRPLGAGFALDPSDAGFMALAMTEAPAESRDPVYDSAVYPDDYSKFLAPGAWKVLPRERLRIRDKVGRAYGFSTTNSEVLDQSTGRSYFLTATLYTNPNGVLNDDDYDYAMADQFFADLGEVVTAKLFVN